MVKDIDPGPDGSDPTHLTNVNGTLYFEANDGTHGVELWKSDGTAAGTVMVKDIDPGADSSVPSDLTNVNGTLYFTADDGAHGFELWKSDGTAAGTVMVKDIERRLLDVDAVDGASNSTTSTARLCFRSDGTAAGTIELASNVERHDAARRDSAPGRRLQRRRLFRHPVAEHEHGQVSIWEMNGNTLDRRRAGQPQSGPAWKAIGTGDFNGDGHSDILWQNTSSGQVSIWEMNGNNLDRRRGRSAPIPGRVGKRSERAISTTTAVPTSCFKTRAAAKSRSGR